MLAARAAAPLPLSDASRLEERAERRSRGERLSRASGERQRDSGELTRTRTRTLTLTLTLTLTPTLTPNPNPNLTLTLTPNPNP